jgi:hypothetical protein
MLKLINLAFAMLWSGLATYYLLGGYFTLAAAFAFAWATNYAALMASEL